MTIYRNDAFVHDKAHVEGAHIEARVKVWQFASVIRGAKIGADSTVASCAIVDGASIGERCIIGHGASVHPGTKIGNDVFVGPSVTFCNDRWPRVPKDGFDLAWYLDGGLCIVVEDEASIGAGAVILPGVKIHSGALIAAGAVVDRDVPACHLFKRNGKIVPIDPGKPARRMRKAA